jgi:hypothetical protein
MIDKTALHVLHTFVEAGRLWVYDDFDQQTDRLVYQGGDDFAVAHSPLRVHITNDRLDTLSPDGTTLSARRQKQ